MSRLPSSEEYWNIVNLFHSDLSVKDICRETRRSYKVVTRIWKEVYTKEDFRERCSRLCRVNKIGDKNPMWGKKGEKHHAHKALSISGLYWTSYAPDWYTGYTYHGKVYDHVLAYCKYHSLTEIPKGTVIHHIDGDTRNNTPENLEMMTISEHITLHWKQGSYVNRKKVQRPSPEGEYSSSEGEAPPTQLTKLEEVALLTSFYG